MPEQANTVFQQVQLKKRVATTAFAAFFLFAIIVLVVFCTNASFDYQVLSKSLTWDNESFTAVIKAITFLGNYQFLVPANLLFILFLLVKRESKLGGLVLFTALTSLGWKYLLKDLFHRPRPAEAMIEGIKNFSFPSGHAMMSVAFYGMLIILTPYFIQNKKTCRLLIIFLSILIIMIGFSRIYLRVHYTSDVLAGYAFGYGWLILCTWLFTRIKAYTQSGAL